MLTKDYTAKLLDLEAYAGNGCAISPTFEAAQKGKNIHCPAADDLFRGSLVLTIKIVKHIGCYRRNVQLVFYDQFD